MSDNSSTRIDKFLWAIRVFKTRSIAADACKKGKIIINDIPVKPSRTVSKSEIIQVKIPPVVYSYKVIEPIEKRVAAKLVDQFAEDITPKEEKAKFDIKHRVVSVHREKGSGRPTKKERRVIDKFRESSNDM